MNRIPIQSKSSQQGVALLEALIAVLIFSMGVLAIAGLQGAMIKNTSDAKYRSDAAFIAQSYLGQMWANPSNLSSFIDATAVASDTNLLPNGTRQITMPSGTSSGEVKVVITWQQPGQATHNYTTYARILGGV